MQGTRYVEQKAKNDKQQIKQLDDMTNEAKDNKTEESHQDWRTKIVTANIIKTEIIRNVWINLDEYIWNNKVAELVCVWYKNRLAKQSCFF